MPFSEVSPTIPNTELIVISDGPFPENCKNLAKTRNAELYVGFTVALLLDLALPLLNQA